MHDVDPPPFPGYLAVERLYAGSRSTVYRARRATDDQPVILKVANAGHMTLEESLARLRHELTILESIRSDRVVRVFDVAAVGDHAVLVVQDFGGESLDRYLARGRLTIADALGVAIGVVTALRDVHAAGIIHKDVTPNNIVFNAATGETRLIDFDVATTWRTEQHGFVSPMTLEGTLLYMAPEQTGRMNRVTDSRADLYGFGVTLFEMLAGRLPFLDSDILSIVHAHLAVRPPAPISIDPKIPRPLSAIVMKLLAKAPEDRYQTAEGLLADLRTCATRFVATGTISDFVLCSDDITTQFDLPAKLYGRSAELGILESAFARTAAGAVEAVLVSGHSGVGKTSVVRELFPLVTRARGYFLGGKFDELRGDTPYPALVAAFDELTHHLLTENEDELARWRDAIGAAIAPNGQIVIDAIPALERIIGPQPPVVALDIAATQSRFNLTLQNFIQVFTKRAHPLVLFLDNMQWADPESAHLLKQVAMSEGTEAFLLIEAFRDNEVSSSHPVMVAARELVKQRRITRLDIAPLPAEVIADLVADALHCDAAVVEPLARLVCRKTDGNPFFVRQLLLALHEAGHIVFDPGLRRFTFDAASIERAPISENVADLLADSLRKLPPSTQHLLSLAAAIGNRFDLELLALIAGMSPPTLHAELRAAFDQELVVPLSELEFVTAPTGSGLVFRRLRFQHDRIQRAAYALTSPENQQRMHLQIGELLLASSSPVELSERIFDIVSHLNRAISLIDDPVRLAELARLDVTAARKARCSAAYATAVDCLRIAVDQLDWHADYREQLDAHVMLAECTYLSGEVAHALDILDAAGTHTTHNRDLGALEALRATIYSHANDMKSAIACTRRAAALLGRVLPDDPATVAAAIEAAIGEIMQRIGSREIEELIDLPAMTDPDALALTLLLRNCIPAAFQAEPALGALITSQIVLLSLEHGNGPSSALSYGVLTSILRGTPLNHLALRFGKLSLELNNRLDDRALRPSVLFAFAMMSSPWLSPIDDAIGYLRDAVRIGREVGDHIHAGNAAAAEIALRVFRGAEPFPEICHDARTYRQHCREVGDIACARLITWQIDRMRVLIGELETLATDDNDTELTLITTHESNALHQFDFMTLFVDTTYSIGDAASAFDIATANRPLEASASGSIKVVEHQFYHCLAAVAMCRQRPTCRPELDALIDANQGELFRSAGDCPANFETMYLLVEAERASLSSELALTLALYDRATESAVRYGRRRLEALAHELHGRFWLDRGKPDVAQIYMLRARNLYAGLGAQRNVTILERKHPGIVRAAGQLRLTGTVTTSTASEVLDVTAIARATRAISGELELEKLLERMLDIIFENAGAEGGALVLDTPQGLRVAASRTGGAPKISTTSIPLAGAPVPRSIVHYVQRTGNVVVLDDAMADPRFGNDEYIQTREPKSVLCMPVKHKDRAAGVLYLENTLISGAFTQSRLDALAILVSQIAVSLENATLFAEQRVQAEAISRANDELRSEILVREQAERELAQYRTQLEELIADRTKELTLANQKLRDAADERERIETELRLAQKLESVGRLAAGIAHEINTPVQYVSDSVTFMRDALPSLVDTIAKYRELATTIDEHGDIEAAVFAARTTEAESDVDYTLANAPSALDAALHGLGRVAAIVRSMKDFAHPDRDEKTLVDLNRAIESTLMIAANECKYIADVETDLAELPLVRCNGGEINQAVLNLVINAAHAIQDVVGQTGAKGKIAVCTRRDGSDVEISIRDTGGGIPQTIHDKIYDPFFTTKEVGRGTGQGLAIVRSVIVDKHSGSLRFVSEPGTGTTFFLRLPIGDALESAA